jgi:undecaprenyl-diphosphatase
MTLAHAILLGIVQGITEFLPISSDGHLAIVQHYLPGFSQPGILFDVLLHVGTLGAVILYFRRDVGLLIAALWRRDEAIRPYRRLLLLIVVASVPTAIIGLTFKDPIERLYDNILLVGTMLLLTGTLVFLAERFRRGSRGETELTFGDAIAGGIAQGCAILPGLSRSGSTIAVFLFKGIDGETAARFSFLMSLPAIAGAALLSLRDLSAIPAGEGPLYLAGAGVALITGLVSIRFLLGIIRRRRLIYFALYCWALGAVFIALNL